MKLLKPKRKIENSIYFVPPFLILPSTIREISRKIDITNTSSIEIPNAIPLLITHLFNSKKYLEKNIFNIESKKEIVRSIILPYLNRPYSRNTLNTYSSLSKI